MVPPSSPTSQQLPVSSEEATTTTPTLNLDPIDEQGSATAAAPTPTMRRSASSPTNSPTTSPIEPSTMMKRSVSLDTLAVQSAYNEDAQSISMVSSTQYLGRQQQLNDGRPMPLDITDVEAMTAANVEIQETILKEGKISAVAAATIIQNKMKVLQTLWEHFPNAISSQRVLDSYKAVVIPRGYTPENTLFAQSICPDEVNHEVGDITDLFTSYNGEVFHMGGLAGIPFTGKVGFGAFSHHVPDDNGHAAILLAPHIGIDQHGKFGAYSREGQDHSGSCCGAAVGAYLHCRANKPLPDLAVNPEFYQFNYIVNQVSHNLCQVVGESECQRHASLARLMHTVGTDLLSKCVNVDFGGPKSTVVILSGIQINMPSPFGDYFLPMEFYILKKDGTREDVFEEAFGHPSELANKEADDGTQTQQKEEKQEQGSSSSGKRVIG